MINLLSSLVTGEQFIVWFAIAFVTCYFIYKEWPEFKRRITSSSTKEINAEQQDKQVSERLAAIERRICSIDDKMQRDYDRLNALEREMKKSRACDKDYMEEQEVIMRSILGVMDGMIEMGIDGPTKEARANLDKYLNHKAHTVNPD